MTRRSAIIALAGACVSPIGYSQSVSDDLRFDVAFRPANPKAIDAGFQILSGGRFRAWNFPVKIVIERAFDVTDLQVIGGPPWIASEKFDFEAKASFAASEQETKSMIRNLVIDRTHMVFHRSTKGTDGLCSYGRHEGTSYEGGSSRARQCSGNQSGQRTDHRRSCRHAYPGPSTVAVATSIRTGPNGAYRPLPSRHYVRSG